MDIERELETLINKNKGKQVGVGESGTGHLDDAAYHVQQPETNIQLTNEQIDRLAECVVDLMKTLYPLIEDVLKTVNHYFDDIKEERAHDKT